MGGPRPPATGQVSVPSAAMRPMRPLPDAVNHIAPSGPTVMLIGWVPLGA